MLTLRAEIQKQYSETDLTKKKDGELGIEDAFLLRIRSAILEHLEEEEFNIPRLCKLVGLSRTQLHRKLVALTGHSASHLIRKIQLEKAKELLSTGKLNVTEVAYQTGFKTQAHFSRVFSDAFGTPPSEYRKG